MDLLDPKDMDKLFKEILKSKQPLTLSETVEPKPVSKAEQVQTRQDKELAGVYAEYGFPYTPEPIKKATKTTEQQIDEMFEAYKK